MFCAECGNKVEEGMRFCAKCGAVIEEESAEARTPKQLFSDSTDVVPTEASHETSDAVPVAIPIEKTVPITAAVGAGQPASARQDASVGGGTTYQDVPAASMSSAQTAGGAPSKNMAIIIAAVAAIAVVAIAAVAFFLGQATSSRSELSGSASASIGSSASSSSSTSIKPVQSQVIEVGDVKVERSDDFAAKGYTWDGSNSSITLRDNKGNPIAAVVWGKTWSRQKGFKVDSYNLIAGNNNFGALWVYCLDANGDAVSVLNDKETGTPATEVYGITADDIVKQVSYRQNGTHTAAQLLSHGASWETNGTATSQSKPTESGENEPFWGVWIGASKDAGEAQTIANEAQGKGLPARVFYTTDWTNLNSEPWYVISVGASASQSDANGLRDKAINAGYGDAYVKYSGDHR